MSSDRIRVSHGRDGVSRITLDFPERKNALDPVAVLALTNALGECDNEESTRVIIIAGAGGAFCAGGDIGSFGTISDTRVRRRGARLVDALLGVEKPLIARVEGAAVGLGLTIALLADFTVAADNAKFGDPHVGLGAVAGDGVAIILPLLVGPQRAKDLLMTGRIIDAAEAYRIGMILSSVPLDRLDREVESLAQRLIEQPPYAMRATKVALNRTIKSAARDVLDLALAYEEFSRTLPDHAEAVKAWKTKRASSSPKSE